MPIIDVHGLRMYYEVHGEGGPLVLIGGLANDVSEFRIITDALAHHHRVLVFDNRGAGRTDKPDEPYSIELMAADTAGLMQATGFDRADIIGVSMGGRIALELAVEHPEMVNRLILLSTAARTVPRLWRSILLDALPRLPLFKGKYPQPLFAFQRQRAASSSYDGTAKLGQMIAPTLILHGQGDKITPYALAEELHRGIPGSTLRPFKGGHLFFLFRQRQEFLEAVEAFLA